MMGLVGVAGWLAGWLKTGWLSDQKYISYVHMIGERDRHLFSGRPLRCEAALVVRPNALAPASIRGAGEPVAVS